MKRIVCICLAALCCMGQSFGAEVVAPSAILMEKETGTILYAKDEHTSREPASVTKVMTLLLVMEAIDAGQLSYDQMLSASDYASSMGGSQIWLEPGESMSVSDMIKAVCVVSANDCAVALAEAVAGSEAAFVEKMNQRAQVLGMADTLFQNATGLPADDHYTSAYDIAIMSRELILNHPDLRAYTTIWMDTLRDGTSELTNTNRLIYAYEGATGLKTGSTSTALYCLSATAEREGMELIAVVLQSPTSNQRLLDVTALLNEGFANYALTQIVPEQVIAPVPVTLGQQGSVQGVIEGSSALLLEKATANNLTQEMTLVETMDAPVAQGTPLGTLVVSADGDVVAELAIVAGETVERLTWWDMVVEVGRMAVLGR